MDGDVETLRRIYDRFNARDIDGVLAVLSDDVAWANGMDGGYVHGPDAVRAYWTRQWAQIDPRVEPGSIVTGPDGRVAVAVHQVVRDLAGKILADGNVTHVYELRDGLVVRMTVEDPEDVP